MISCGTLYYNNFLKLTQSRRTEADASGINDKISFINKEMEESEYSFSLK